MQANKKEKGQKFKRKKKWAMDRNRQLTEGEMKTATELWKIYILISNQRNANFKKWNTILHPPDWQKLESAGKDVKKFYPHCWWNYKLVQTFCTAIWKYLVCVYPHNLEILLLGIYCREFLAQRSTQKHGDGRL